MRSGTGVTSQLTMTNPTGSPSASTTRIHGWPSGSRWASTKDSPTPVTNRSCSGATRSASTAVAVAGVTVDRVTGGTSRGHHGHRGGVESVGSPHMWLNVELHEQGATDDHDEQHQRRPDDTRPAPRALPQP